MINPENYLKNLNNLDINFFAGVPDSLLKDFCACISEKCNKDDHTITANEGAAVGLAIGYYLGTNKIPMVYLQNSGLGNIINPILSLASNQVYGIPMLIMIGWRGEPGVKDEPQHVHQGQVMLQSLESMDLPYIVLSDNEDEALTQTENASQIARQKNSPVFIVVRKNSFKKFQQEIPLSNLDMSREDAVIGVASMLPDNARVVCTTGMPSRELFEYRANNNLGHQKDFLTVGGMGHASQIALGLSKSQPNRPIYCFDGDGAALMHMGSMAIIGQSKSHNLIHIVFNNGAHASVGGQPTVGHGINFCDVAKACGYTEQIKIESKTQLNDMFMNIHLDEGPHFIEICIRPGNKNDIGRPTSSPQENKHAIMQSLMK